VKRSRPGAERRKLKRKLRRCRGVARPQA
jgi:hypothetical protein